MSRVMFELPEGFDALVKFVEDAPVESGFQLIGPIEFREFDIGAGKGQGVPHGKPCAPRKQKTATGIKSKPKSPAYTKAYYEKYKERIRARQKLYNDTRKRLGVKKLADLKGRK